MGWISWLCPGINLKRWLLLFAVGVLLCALGLALFFNYQLMGKAEELLFQMTYLTTGRYSNGLIMTMGVGFLIVGFAIMVYGTRRLISSVVSVVVPDKNGSLMETIFMQRKLTRGPAITVVGGGTGLSTLLRGMKYITNNCTAVVTTADDGGSSGRLRKELGIIPPGDLRNCLTALADREPLMERLMQYRFQGDSPLAGHCFGNLFIAAMAQAEGGMEAGLNATSQILKVRGRVIPSTLEDIRLQARMTDGSIVTGESEIPKVRKHIKKMMMLPADAQAANGAIDAILNADVLIFGPGSLYTSVIPNLLVEGIRDAVVRSKASKIYICNVMTQPGETDGTEKQTGSINSLVAEPGGQFRHEKRRDTCRNRIYAIEHAHPSLRRAFRKEHSPISHGTGNGWLQICPHDEQCRPREELGDAQTDHCRRGIAEQCHETGLLCRSFHFCQSVVFGKFFRRIFLGFECSDQYGSEQDGSTYII